MTTLAEYKDRDIMDNARHQGIRLTQADARTLRRAELTLSRWDEQRCGWSTQGPYGASVALVRDEDGDGKPYLEIHPNASLKTIWKRIPDRERGALRRVAEVCDRLGLHYYHQEDPRGCSLYIDDKPIPANNYTRAVAVS